MRRRGFLRGIVTGAAALGVSPVLAKSTLSNAVALSGDRFSADGDEFILANVLAPPLYTLDNRKPAYFDVSQAALQQRLSRPVEVQDVMPPTRWGVRPVLARPTDGAENLQEALIKAGAVMVAPQTEDHIFIRHLLDLEREARAEKRGLWALDEYRAYDAGDASGAIGAYRLIEGTVLSAEKHGARFYLNFGEDYRSDFTAGAPSRLYASWKKNGFDLASLNGVGVRVRGYVEAINGPSIDLNHSLQIERID